MTDDQNTIIIVSNISDIPTPPETDQIVDDDMFRGSVFERLQGQKATNTVNVDVVRNNTKMFFESISEIFEEVETNFRSFELQEVEITAAFTGNGKLALIGGGIEAGFTGGVKFVFKRSKEDTGS